MFYLGFVLSIIPQHGPFVPSMISIIFSFANEPATTVKSLTRPFYPRLPK